MGGAGDVAYRAGTYRLAPGEKRNEVRFAPRQGFDNVELASRREDVVRPIRLLSSVSSESCFATVRRR